MLCSSATISGCSRKLWRLLLNRSQLLTFHIPGGAATLSCQLQVSHDGALILLVPVLDYSASLVRDGASLFTRIWDIPFS